MNEQNEKLGTMSKPELIGLILELQNTINILKSQIK